MHKILTILAAVVLSVTMAVPAEAARPFHAGRTAATITVSPSAPTVGSNVVFAGCGYEPGVGVNVVVNGPSATSFMGDLADAEGCFTTADNFTFPVNDVGTYEASAYQSRRNKADATVTFNVT